MFQNLKSTSIKGMIFCQQTLSNSKYFMSLLIYPLYIFDMALSSILGGIFADFGTIF